MNIALADGTQLTATTIFRIVHVHARGTDPFSVLGFLRRSILGNLAFNVGNSANVYAPSNS